MVKHRVARGRGRGNSLAGEARFFFEQIDLDEGK